MYTLPETVCLVLSVVSVYAEHIGLDTGQVPEEIQYGAVSKTSCGWTTRSESEPDQLSQASVHLKVRESTTAC